MKLKKEKSYDVGILSFNMNTFLSNFGAALHSYAFQKYLEKHNINSVIINYQQETPTRQYIRILRKYKFFVFPHFISMIKKKKYFDHFFQKYCVVTQNQYNKETLKSLHSINRYCIETDITWCTFRGKHDRAFMCDLNNQKNKPNIAYSVDFGSSELTTTASEALKEYANNFKYISVRNIFKLDYIKKILNRNDIVITIDPVFLLDKKDYMNITKLPHIKEDYLLVYNCKENHPAMVDQAKIYAKKHNLKIIIINCYDGNLTTLTDDNPTPISIEDFLGYIHSCKCCFTNSYHGLCFSIIYGVPFFAFSRKANNEKILTILESFDLHHRFVNNEIPNNEINWQHVNNKWGILRKEAESFLNEAIILNKPNRETK